MISENARRFKFGKKLAPKPKTEDILPAMGDAYAVVDKAFDRDDEYIEDLVHRIERNGML